MYKFVARKLVTNCGIERANYHQEEVVEVENYSTEEVVAEESCLTVEEAESTVFFSSTCRVLELMSVGQFLPHPLNALPDVLPSLHAFHVHCLLQERKESN